MKVGIAGLGLIGGSLAKAYHCAGHDVLAYDRDPSVLGIASVAGITDGELNKETLPSRDLILIALYPNDAIEYMENNAPSFSPGTLVIDCCGTKGKVCESGFRLGEDYGFTFAGGHPMAGTQYSGFAHSRENLFEDAVMVIVPPRYDDILLLENIKQALSPLRLKEISVTAADEHDRLIAFTSQLAHVVSNAYIKSPTARNHKGVSAGSYRDLTRVAWLNPDMWTALFIENRTHLTGEIDILINELTQYRNAISSCDDKRLWNLLDEGRRRKEEIDGEMK
ncbi:MAG: prephenate dehydrogenase/arogenate dehydrogenase family protein [Eubacteriales bacterium]|jgi:prephenate dehydrogenase|nr:prephenate dehydrogenase/arogenate dehydrogenase family protein [Eubacteriales bacterium]MDD4104685.1 prephenate dehydrogenase/arogenate dehydrogenase family protein [Eubacteriales bacterium]MDD4710981.1 prephenate dehydrogenase/arogenate dehydrogenase family protein [Eubacteriales bacterium]